MANKYVIKILNLDKRKQIFGNRFSEHTRTIEFHVRQRSCTFVLCRYIFNTQWLSKRTAKDLVRLRGCAVWAGPLLSACALVTFSLDAIYTLLRSEPLWFAFNSFLLPILTLVIPISYTLFAKIAGLVRCNGLLGVCRFSS